MPSIPVDSLSPFGRMAVKLDTAFSELNRISGQIQRMEIHSDSGLERAVKLLNEFAQNGQTIAENIQEFSRTLADARAKSEAAAHIVSERAQLVQQRRQQQNHIQDKLTQIEQKVKAANASLADFRKHNPGELSDEQKIQIKTHLEQLNQNLADFIEAVQAVKAEAAQAKFKGIERDAESLLGALQASRRKLRKVMEV